MKLVKVTDSEKWVTVYKNFDIYYDADTKTYIGKDKENITIGKTIDQIMSNINKKVNLEKLEDVKEIDIKDKPEIDEDKAEAIGETADEPEIDEKVYDLLRKLSKLKAMLDAAYWAKEKAQEYKNYNYAEIAASNQDKITDSIKKVEAELTKLYKNWETDKFIKIFVETLDYYVRDYDYFYSELPVETFLRRIFR